MTRRDAKMTHNDQRSEICVGTAARTLCRMSYVPCCTGSCMRSSRPSSPTHCSGAAFTDRGAPCRTQWQSQVAVYDARRNALVAHSLRSGRGVLGVVFLVISVKLASVGRDAGGDLSTSVSTRKVSAIVEALCGEQISASQVSAITSRRDTSRGAWRARSLGKKAYRYLIVDA